MAIHFRPITAGFEALLDLLEIPAIKVLVDVADTDDAWTDYAHPIVYGGTTYEPKPLVVTELGENLVLRSPVAEIRAISLDASEQTKFVANSFQGSLVTIRVVFLGSMGSFSDSGWVTTYKVDRDLSTPNEVRLKLASSDAAAGSLVPRLSTSTEGCRRRLGVLGCDFRPTGLASTADVRLRTMCDRTLLGELGCVKHYPDLDENGSPWVEGTSTGTRYIQPKPFLAFPGAVGRAVVGSA